jgi:hypothetical protein
VTRRSGTTAKAFPLAGPQELEARLLEVRGEPFRGDEEDPRGRLGVVRRGLAAEAPEEGPVRLHVGDVLEERDETRLERGLLRADGPPTAPQGRDARGGLRRVLRLEGAGPESREEALALAEDRGLGDDLLDLLEADAARRREDEAHRDLDLAEDDRFRTRRDGPREGRERLGHGADDAVDGREERLVDVAGGEGREKGLEGRQGDRSAAPRRRAGPEGAFPSLVARPEDAPLAPLADFVVLGSDRHGGLLGVARK